VQSGSSALETTAYPSFLYIMGLTAGSLCGSCRAEKETSVHVLCECEAVTTPRHAYVGAFVLNPEDVVGLSLGAVWNFIKGATVIWISVCRVQRA
jgi:hypothetical protein